MMCLGPPLDPAMVMPSLPIHCNMQRVFVLFKVVDTATSKQSRRGWKGCILSQNLWEVPDIEENVYVLCAELGFHRMRSSETKRNVQHSVKTLGWCVNNETRTF